MIVPLSIDAALNGAGLVVSGWSSCCAWLPAHASPTPVMRTDPDFAPARWRNTSEGKAHINERRLAEDAISAFSAHGDPRVASAMPAGWIDALWP